MAELSSLVFDFFMLPFERKGLSRVRKTLLKHAEGKILEIGAGTGVNLQYYDPAKIEKLTLLDIKITQTLQEKSADCAFPVEFIEASAEKMPFESKSFDTVVVTLVFCSIPDVMKALNEVHRVLKDDGKLIFIEHVIAPNSRLAKIQNLLNTPWKAVAGGCNLNRDTRELIERSGFTVSIFKSLWSDIFISGTAKKL